MGAYYLKKVYKRLLPHTRKYLKANTLPTLKKISQIYRITLLPLKKYQEGQSLPHLKIYLKLDILWKIFIIKDERPIPGTSDIYINDRYGKHNINIV